MMIRYLVAVAALSLLVVAPVQARTHHRHHGAQGHHVRNHAHHAGHRTVSRSQERRFVRECRRSRCAERIMDDRLRRPNVDVASSRPADCYGIPWCGCWLRHALGIADKGLNLAANWAHVGQAASADTANVALWPNGHHVGKVLQAQGDRVLVVSGNSGHRHGGSRGVNARWVGIRGMTFRRV